MPEAIHRMAAAEGRCGGWRRRERWNFAGNGGVASHSSRDSLGFLALSQFLFKAREFLIGC